MELFKSEYDDENIPTYTSEAIKEKALYINALKIEGIELNKLDHQFYLKNLINLTNISGLHIEPILPQYIAFFFSPSKILNLDENDNFPLLVNKLIDVLDKRKSESTLLSGFPSARSNIILTMLGITSVIISNNEKAYKILDPKKIYDTIKGLKCSDGSFCAVKGGEIDIRSTFSAIAICHLLNILTDEIKENVIEYTLQCYNYDGGFAPVPLSESHSGFVHCGIGILYLLDKLELININSTVRYIASRQDPFSGGFSGRTNKLVDSCYTWWLGTAARMISEKLNLPEFWDSTALTKYTLQCSQNASGGFRDSPPSNPDPYHTCYSLAGLCTACNRSICNFNIPDFDLIFPAPKKQVDAIRKYFKENTSL